MRRAGTRSVLVAAVLGAGVVVAADGLEEPAGGPGPSRPRVPGVSASAFRTHAWSEDEPPVVRQDPDLAPRLDDFVRRLCLPCHDGDAGEGGLDLSRIADERGARARPTLFRAASARVAAREMPPAGSPQPGDLERARFLAFTTTLDTRDAEPATSPREQPDGKGARAGTPRAQEPGPATPPRVVLRRLTRHEYARCVADLVGADVSPDEFPADDLGYGFDTVGEVLTVSPALLDRYTAVARRIAEEAIVVDDPAERLARRTEAESVVASSARAPDGATWGLFFSAGRGSVRWTAPRDGTYVLRARACGDRAGDELPALVWDTDGRAVGRVEVEAPRSAPAVYEVRVRLARGDHETGFAFTNDFYQPEAPAAARDRNLMVDWIEIDGPTDAAELPPSHRRIFAADPGKGDAQSRARAVLRPLATRAWRRPVTEEELSRLARIVTKAVADGRPFERGVRTALRAILVSPHFVYRVEKGGAARPLDGHEVAARLALFLWSGLPDDRLLAAATEGRLRTADGVAAEARRMLADPRASALATHFAAQWLELRGLAAAAPDPVRFPDFDEDLRASMGEETRAFFEAVLREDRDVRELLDTDWTFADERLARHYGIPGVRGPHLRRVLLPDGRRGGVLTHASVLTVTSLATRTSPVKRGKWVLDHVLASPPPPPPPGADSFAGGEAALASRSLREQMERHRKDPSCAGCHKGLDAIGLAFENFDALGRWRDADGTFPIDPSGRLPDGRTFADAAELRRLLAAGDAFPRALAKKLAVYAIGRGTTPADEPAFDALVRELPAGRRTLADLIVGVVRSDLFRSRGPDPGE